MNCAQKNLAFECCGRGLSRYSQSDGARPFDCQDFRRMTLFMSASLFCSGPWYQVLVDVTYVRKVDQAGRERGVPSPAVKIMERPSYVKAVVSTAIPLGRELLGDASESPMSFQSLSSQRRSAMLSAIDVLVR